MTGMEALAKIQAMGCSCYCAAMAKEIAAQVIPLPESEILARAREAAVAAIADPVHGENLSAEEFRSGRADHWAIIKAAINALRDLAKPLSEVVPAPPVDPDLIEARRIAEPHFLGAHGVQRGEYDDSETVSICLAAIRRGRELEREARS